MNTLAFRLIDVRNRGGLSASIRHTKNRAVGEAEDDLASRIPGTATKVSPRFSDDPGRSSAQTHCFEASLREETNRISIRRPEGMRSILGVRNRRRGELIERLKPQCRRIFSRCRHINQLAAVRRYCELGSRNRCSAAGESRTMG